jgi:uncharacterized protein
MDNPIQVDLGRIAQDLQIRRVQVESVVQLLDEGNTVPFITRYRKERTGNLNEVAIYEVQVRVGRLRELAERKETILKSIEAQGKLTDELAATIRSAENSKRLEDLYLPYKPKKKTKASEARDKGLEPLALRVWNRDETLTDLPAAAVEFVDAEKGLDSPEKVLEGVGHILAEAISEMAVVRDAARRAVWKTGKISTIKGEIPEGQGLEFRDYFEYSEPIAQIPPHRVLAINRGDKEGPLKVKLEVSRPDLEGAVLGSLPLEGHPQSDFFRSSAVDALDRLLLPSLEREVRRDLTEMAERHAVEVFARNLRSLLLQPPIPRQVVLAIDPGLRHGCKVAVLDGFGTLLDSGVVFPHAPQNRRHEAKMYLKDLVGKHKVGVVAIGNGTACRETEELVAEIIAEGTRFHEAGETPETYKASHPQVQAQPESSPAQAPAPSNGEAHAAAEGEPATEPTAQPVDVAQVPQEMPTMPMPNTGEESHEDPTPAPEHPPASEPAPETDPSATSPSDLPPISGGSGEDEHDNAGEAPTSAHEEPVAPPPSSAPEAATNNTESHRAETLAHSDQTRNPAAEPATEGTPSEGAGEAQAPAEGAAAPTEGGAPAEGAADAPTEGAVPAASAAPAPQAQAPSRPPRGDRSGNKPKGDGGPRPPKVKPGPPPPPTPHVADPVLAQLSYVIVNEAGASVYSVSPVGREEFPESDDKVRGTVSIGRRLQDPLSELVKIEPQNIGVGLYQHDVNPKQLKESLEAVIMSCVNFVGVDLNSASVPLLRHVSGLNQVTARRVVEYRQAHGPFTDRGQLMQVEGIGPSTFTQAAGFLKVREEGANPLDRTWVHPESYEAASKLVESLGFGPEIVIQKDRLPELHEKLATIDIPAVARDLNVGEPTLADILDALARPERDPRDDLPKPIFKKGILKLEDLSAGMELKGTVLNVVDFGAFVDIGLKDSGLVHISQLANRYIKSPHDVVSVGDVVDVWVMSVDQERKRVSLTMVQPGTERPRGQQGGPGGAPGGPGGGGNARRGEPRPAGPGGDRRPAPGPRPPRREGPILPGVPVGPTAGPGAPSEPGQGPGPGQGQGAGPAPGGARYGGGQGGAGRPGGGGQGGGARFGGGGGRPGGGGQGGPGRGGPRFGSSRPPDRPTAPLLPPKPAKPLPPPPPLSKDALAGSVPLRTFGQLKQLWQARDPEEGEEGGPGEGQGQPSSGENSQEQAPQQQQPPAQEGDASSS